GILDGTFQAQKFAPWNKESREQANLTPKSARDRPAGTVTFLFTDIEGSTQLWESYPDAMPAAFARHEAIIRSTMETHSGFVYKMVGDAFQVAFATAPDALAAAIDTQRALLAEPWVEVGSLKVRIALHTGVTEERGDDYVGPTLNRAARLLNAGYGGQILLNQSTFELVHDRLPPGISLQDLGKHYLKDIASPEHIYQPAGPGLAPGFPPLRTAGTRPIHLPIQATPFIGRKSELAKLETMIANPECRLFTLVGIGGSGKTRLSIQAAEQSVGFPHGIYFAGLANITSLEDMILAIAEAVRVTLHAPPGRSLSLKEAQDQLFQSLAETKSLIVLDNFEQLIPCAQFLSELLDAAPGVKLIVTSRERLNLPEEWILEVIGLSFPGRLEDEEILEYPAVQLFIKCAERSGNFTATADDWKAIARICQLVEGVPLAVEMAAAWVKVFSCPEIAAEIERDLDFLAATWRGMPERHQTLRAVFEHSWRLLSESVQEVFCRLAVFRSGFPREAALEVAGASLHVLTDLVDKSFVRRKSSGRFEIHPVLKQYATQKLAENTILHTETRFRHAVYYCKWLDCMNEQLVGSEQLTALFALRTETQNLRSAWQFLVEKGDFERLKIILPAVVLFYVMNDQRVETQEVIQLLHDTIHLLRKAVDQHSGESTGSLPACTYQGLLALSLATLRHFSFDPTHIELTHPYQIESLKLVDPLPDCQEKAYTILLNCTKAGNITYSRTIDYCQECIGIFERMGNAWGVAMTKLILADSALFGGKDLSLARASYQSSLEGFTMLGNNWGKALCLSGFSLVERQEGNLEKAYELGYESFKIYDQMNSAERVQDLRLRLGEIADKLGRIEDARTFFEANLAYYIKIGDIERQRLIKEWLEKLGKGEFYYRGLDVP
ncbi:MAG: adenylate/guanylate cyclase domain-containing protein, partial [Omnitrophica WOR_2 bacterium]